MIIILGEFKMGIAQKVRLGIVAVGLAALVSGCRTTPALDTYASQHGGRGVAKKGDYIIVRVSGGNITDVYKLEDVLVIYAESKEELTFMDKKGNTVTIEGDAKVIRLKSKDKALWEQYHEYHKELEGGDSYFDAVGK